MYDVKWLRNTSRLNQLTCSYAIKWFQQLATAKYSLATKCSEYKLGYD